MPRVDDPPPPIDASVIDISEVLETLELGESPRETSPKFTPASVPAAAESDSAPLDLDDLKAVDLEGLPPEVWHLVK